MLVLSLHLHCRLIHGFISKQECKRRLMEANVLGQFFIRFSQSEIEDSQKTNIGVHLTVAVLEIDPCNPTKCKIKKFKCNVKL